MRSLFRAITSRVNRMRDNPDSPWLWREDWASGRLHYSESRKVGFPLVLGLAAFATFLVLILLYREAIPESPAMVVALVAVLPIAGIVGVVIGGTLFLRWKRYGRSTAVLHTNPGVVGGWLRLDCEVNVEPAPTDRFNASLKCLNRGKGEGGGGTSVVWRLERELDFGEMRPGEGRTVVVPVAFYIPYDCPETSVRPSGFFAGQPSGYFWKVQIRGRLRGPNYFAEFLVPVFKTAESTLDVPQEAVDQFGAEATGSGELTVSRADVESLPCGGLEVKTRPVQYLPVKIFSTCLAFASLYWLVALVQQSGVLFFPNVIALSVTAALTLVVGWQWFGVRHLRLSDGRICMAYRLPGLSRESTVSVAEVDKVRFGVGGRISGKELWQVYLVLSGKGRVFSTGLSAAEARWLAQVLADAIGRERGSKVAVVEDSRSS